MKRFLLGGFKPLDNTLLLSTRWSNPIPFDKLKYCLRDLLYEVHEKKISIKDFVIVSDRKATGSELTSRDYYRVYVLYAE